MTAGERPVTSAPVFAAKSGGPSWYWACICTAALAHINQERAYSSAARHAGKCPAARERIRANQLRRHVAARETRP